MAYIIDSELMKTQRPFYIRFAQYYSLYLFPRGRGFLFLTCARANALASPLFSPFPHTSRSKNPLTNEHHYLCHR
jgi:hypothetical protein